ncbi:FapA family protein [Desulfurispira natronophila]|uniref:DUF342 domain-containing protein n=1 Tax=Desulfurispira natronophila TaxID=682562 RepID=A0A7W8DGY8_9BACT|nr:FapA family protein [Desulfurispira natronophila]MBB5021854.1 hypothetical protein [Desulfurispira natronophila]
MDNESLGILEEQLETSNILESLIETTHKHHVTVEELDFAIHHMSDMKRGDDFFYRTYIIDIFRKGFSPVELNYTLKTASNTTYLRLLPSSTVDTAMASPLEVLGEVKKILAKEGIIFGVIDDEELYRIAAAVHRSFVDKADIPDEPYPVAHGQTPRDGVAPPPVVFHFDKYNLIHSDSEQDPMMSPFEMGKDTFIVRKDELLITDPIPDQSVLQISPSGYVVSPGTTGQRLPFHDISPDIRREEDNTAVYYYAEKDGYLSVEKGTLLIRPQVVFEADVLEKEPDSNLSKKEDIVIEASDETQDAVGAGQTIEGRNVTINGHVGAGATIRGQNVTVNGVLHKEATVIAENRAFVDISKGSVTADRAHINMLEGGTVEAATSVEVTGKSMQSIIKSPRIFINELKNCGVTTGGYQIRINSVTDGSNFFTIDPLTIPTVNQRYQQALLQQKDLLKKLRSIRQTYSNRKNQLSDVRKQYEPMRGKIEKMRTKSLPVPAAFQNIVERYNKLSREIITLKQQAQVIVRKLSTLEDFIYRIQYVDTTTSFTVYKRLPKGNVIRYGKASAHITVDQDLVGITVSKNRSGKLEYRIAKR